jgi:hypothetical protein
VFRRDYPLIVSISTENARFFQRVVSPRAGRHRLGFLKCVNRSRVQAAAVACSTSCDGHDVGVVAPGAIKMCGYRSWMTPAQRAPDASLHRILGNAAAGWR